MAANLEWIRILKFEIRTSLVNAENLCQRHDLTVPRAGDRSNVTGSIRGWSRSHLTYTGWLLTQRAQAHLFVFLKLQYGSPSKSFSTPPEPNFV